MNENRKIQKKSNVKLNYGWGHENELNKGVICFPMNEIKFEHKHKWKKVKEVEKYETEGLRNGDD